MAFSEKAVRFDGVDEYVDVANTYDFDRTDAFSISYWVKAPAAAGSEFAIAKGAPPSPEGWWSLIRSDGKVVFAMINTWTTNDLRVRADSVNIRDDKWHHVVATHDGTGTAAGVNHIIDGVLATAVTESNTLSGSTLNSASLRFGTRENGFPSESLAGRLDEVAIYDKELSLAEAQAIYNSGEPDDLSLLSTASNLVGWWRMGDGDTYPTLFNQITGEATYPTIPDESGGGSDGTMTNMLASNIRRSVPRSAFSKYSLRFDGSNEYLTFGDVLDFEYDDPFALSAWIKTTNASGTRSIVSKLDNAPNSRGWDLYQSSGGLAFILSSVWGTQNILVSMSGAPAINNGEWHHVLVTYAGDSDAANVKFYVDGTLYGTTVLGNTLTTGTTVSSAAMEIGRRYQTANHQYFDGFISDVAVYDAELDQAAVTWIYNGGLPRDLRLPAAPSDLLAYWRLGDGAECVQSSWTHKIQQWRWDALATKESATITDAGPFNSPGTLYGMTADDVTADTPGGISNYSCTFGPAPAYSPLTTSIQIASGPTDQNEGGVFPDPLTIPPTGQAFTMGCWCKRSVAANERVLVSKCRGTGSSRSWYLQSYDTDSWRVGWSDNNYDLGFGSVSTPPVLDGNWHLVLMTWDGVSYGNSKIYVDGVGYSVAGGGNQSGFGGCANDGSFVVGGRWSGTSVDTNWYQGNVCHSFLYDKVLSDAEVLAIYGGGIPQDLNSVGPTANLKHWAAMGDGDALGAGNVIDLSPAGLDGTYVNGESGDFQLDVPSGGAPKGMFCNVGSSQYGPYAFEVGATATFSGWIKTTATDGYMWGNAATFVNASNTIMYLDGGRPVFMQGNNFPTSAVKGRCDNTINDGQWHHIVGTGYIRGGWQIKIWVDGVAQPVTIIQNNNSNSMGGNGFSIGARGADQLDPLDAKIDEVAVWRMPFSQTHVDELYGSGVPLDLRDLSTVGMLAGWWRMGDAYELSGTSVNMEVEDKRAQAPGPDNYTVRSMWFDGANEYVQIDNADAFNFEYTDAFSISQWVQPIGLNAYRTLFWKHPYPGYSIDCYGGSGGATYYPLNNLRVYMRDSGSGLFEVYLGSRQRTAPFGTYFHLVVTYDGSNSANGIKIYIDGVEWPVYVRYNTAMTGTMKNTSSVRLGYLLWPGTSEYIGWMDETSVWDKELSQADVTELFNGGDPADLSTHTSVNNLIGWWRMGEGRADGTMVNMAADNIVNILQQAEADLVGDASITALGGYLLEAEAALEGDSAMTGELLGDLEVAADVVGDASITAAVTASFGAAASVEGGSEVLAHPIVKVPEAERTYSGPLRTTEQVQRLAGFQPDRKPVVIPPKFNIGPKRRT